MVKVWHKHDLNCQDSHVLNVTYHRTGKLAYGWAIGPDGRRYQHVWVERDGELIDLFGWTDHERLGERYMPPSKDVKELLKYLKLWHIDLKDFA